MAAISSTDNGSQPFSTAKRERFVNFCGCGLDPHDAYKRAGYSYEHTAVVALIQDEEIRLRIGYLTDKLSDTKKKETLKLDFTKGVDRLKKPIGKKHPTSLKDPSINPPLSERDKVLQSIKHERFCVNMSMGKSQIQSYIDAGYARNPGNASELANKPEIKERIRQLMEDFTDEHLSEEDYSDTVYDEDWACHNLNVIFKAAKNAQDFKEARACVNDILSIKGVGEKNRIAGAKAKLKPTAPALPAPNVNLQIANATITAGPDEIKIEALPDNLKDVT